ncbi:MAG: hypothetical protein QME68_08370, partial [Elusimicrobiota bacterium]|nr:hypothetical protein [Elusimicrobiota bacterium]
ENLSINTTHTFWLSTVSSDELESEKVSVTVYLEYPEILQVNVNIPGKKYNGMPVEVTKKPSIDIEFNKVVDTTTVNQNTIYIRAIKDNRSNAIDNIITAPLSITDKRRVKLIPELNYGYKYQLIISSVTDLLGQSISASFEFVTIYDLNIENKIVPNTTSYVEISIPTGASKQKGYIIVSEDSQKTEVNTANSKLTSDYVPLKIVQIDLYNEQDNKINVFEKYFTITIGYSDKDNDGFGIKTETLSIWYLDEVRRAWMKLPTTIDKIRKVLIAKTKHLGVFTIIGMLNYSTIDVQVYPVPWVPEDGKSLTGTLQEGISFINLPVEGELSIYTITGELVKKIEFKDNYEGKRTWYGENQEGNKVASGVYLWIVKSPKDKKTGKLIVIR